MDSGDVSLRPAPPPLPGGLSGASLPAPATQAPENPFGDQEPKRAPLHGVRKRIGSIIAGIVAIVVKFFSAIKGFLLLLPKIKLLTTAGTALISVAAYSLWFGWTFAIGFVVLLFVHEMGHVIQLRREGIAASAPMFIPFLGAAVMMKSMPDDALAEARVGLAGPILGTAGAGVCLAIGDATDSDLLRALAYVGFFLNLINLIPVVPFDGGRAMAAMAPWMWFVGFGAMVALVFIAFNPFLLIFALLAGMETYRRWEQRKKQPAEQAAYYRVSLRNRLIVGGVYLTLIALLVFGMQEAHILSSAGHSFRSL